MPVYFLRSGDAGPVKIGLASNVKARIAVLQTGHPARLNVLREVAGDSQTEAYFHRLYAADQLHGEWFSFIPSMLSDEAPQFPAKIVREDPGLQAAKLAAGSAKSLAQLLEISAAAVCRWKGQIPLKRVVQIEKATGVPRHVLRPDLFNAPAKRARTA